MPTLNRSYPEYVPNDEPFYAIPVQQGDVFNLSIAITPNRQGILGWYDPTANEMRCAVVPDFDDCFDDDVVAPGDVRTVLDVGALGRTVHTGVIWAWDSRLYAFVSHYTATSGRIVMYEADDIENPVTWTQITFARDHTGPGGGGSTITCAQGGGPTVLENGDWIMPMGGWLTFAASTLEDCVGIETNTAEGTVGWNIPVQDRKTALQGGTAGPQSTTVAQDPTTGDLWFGSNIGPAGGWRPYSSSDDGVTWATNEQSSGALVPHYYLDDGTNVYAGLISLDAMDLYRIEPSADFTDPSTWTDLGMRGIVSGGYTPDDGFQITPIAWPLASNFVGMAFTAKDRVAWHPLCDPIHPDPLFIPYKDRLLGVARDFTDDGITRAIDQQFQNFKEIETWAGRWMAAASDPDRCGLFIPHKEHSAEPWPTSARQSFENWKVIERWAQQISDGDCGCSCAGATEPPERCRLFVPHKDALGQVTDPTDLASLRGAGELEFDNFKELERWANRYASAECGCTA